MTMTLTIYKLQPQTIDLSQGNFPILLRIWQGNALELPADGTHFGYVYQGQADLVRQDNAYPLRAGMYFCLPGVGKIEAESSGIVITHMNYRGMFSLGGPMESSGRLAYIDGGSSSLLVPPVIRGDPCLNALYFPPKVDQTLHTHPSDRIGIVVAGSGQLEMPQTAIPLEPGVIVVIPAHSLHKFRTLEHNLTVVMFHPDSDAGFTHQDHPMLNRTLVEGVSAAKLPHIQTNLNR
jgi:mannose-6-phosphate isomerase-like protein (cupin superfamily)